MFQQFPRDHYDLYEHAYVFIDSETIDRKSIKTAYNREVTLIVLTMDNLFSLNNKLQLDFSFGNWQMKEQTTPIRFSL